MTKIKLLTSNSQKLRELLRKVDIKEPLCLELDLEDGEELLLNLQISEYEKINIINNLLNKQLIVNGIYLNDKRDIKDTYTLTKNNINNDLFIDTGDINKEIEKELLSLLRHLGINPHHVGYSYLKEGILYYFSSKHIINNMTEVYKKIAKKYDTSISSVESGIRRAIEEGFKNANPEYIKLIFGYSLSYDNVSPTNSIFIIAISDYLKTEYNRYN